MLRSIFTGVLFFLFGQLFASSPPPVPNANLPVSVSMDTICYGQSVNVIVSLSEIGVSYQLIESFSQVAIGVPMMGTGGNINLPSGQLFTNTVFDILATDTSDGSTAVLINQGIVTVRPGIEGAIYPDSVPACPNTPINFSFNDYALDVNGTNQYARIPASPSLLFTNAITVEAWINADTWTTNRQEGVIVSTLNFSGAVGHEGYEIRVGDNGIVNFEVGITGNFVSYEAFSTQLMNTGTWYHIAGTYDGIEVKVLLNGVPLDSTGIAGTIANSPLDLQLGKQAQFPVGRFFDGQIDEVRIWDYARTPAQIQSGMNQVLGGTEPGLAAYYRANDGPGSTVITDSSPNGNNGNLINLPAFTAWSPTGPLLPPIASYAWAFGDGNTSTLPTPTNTYLTDGPFSSSVVLTDGSGCVAQPTRGLTIVPLPVVNLGPDTSLCGAGNVILDAGAGGTMYAWSNGATTQTISVTVADTYFVAVTSSVGCIGRDTVVVAGGNALVVNLGNDTTLCAGNSLFLNAGVAGASYIWSTGDTTQTIVVSGPGQVIVDVADSNGCSGADTILVSVAPSPGAFLIPDTSFCTGDSVTLASGVLANSYDWNTGPTTPSIVVSTGGQYILTIQDNNGCLWMDTTQVTVNPLPTVLLTGAAPAFCFGDPSVTLQGSPAGGIFAGPGVTGSVFDPGAVPAPDTVLISYQYTDVNGCQNADSEQVIIRALPVVGFTGLAASYCDNDSAVVLTPAPAGGVFSGPGVLGTGFAPLLAGAGTHTITYLFTDAFGCIAQSDQSTLVNQAPNVSVTTPLTVLCSSSPAVQLTTVPAGGTLVGNGLTGTSFDPGLAGLGFHPISYLFTDVNGCANKDSLTMEVVLQPTAALTGLVANYCDNDAAVGVAGTPAGGVLTGPGTSGSGFDPGAAGAGGPYTLVYTYSVSAGCADADTQLVTVFAAPVVSIAALDTAYCSSSAPVQLLVQPAGGTLNGPAINGTLFDPSVAPIGPPLDLFYTYTDGNGCSNQDSVSTTVFASPGPALAGIDRDVYFSNTSTLNATPPLVGSGLWEVVAGSGQPASPSAANTDVSNLSDGLNTFRWKISNGPCLETDEITLNVIPFDPVRGFSPNGDGVNETFEIPGLTDFPNSKMQVFDKLGNLIIASDDYQNDWAGLNENGNELPEDTYYYTLEVSNGVQVNGLVLLKR